MGHPLKCFPGLGSPNHRWPRHHSQQRPDDSGCVFPATLAGQDNAAGEGRKTQSLFVIQILYKLHSRNGCGWLEICCTLYPLVWPYRCQLTQRSFQLLQEAGECDGLGWWCVSHAAQSYQGSVSPHLALSKFTAVLCYW